MERQKKIGGLIVLEFETKDEARMRYEQDLRISTQKVADAISERCNLEASKEALSTFVAQFNLRKLECEGTKGLRSLIILGRKINLPPVQY